MTGTAVRPIDKRLTFGLAVVAYDRNHGYAIDILHQDRARLHKGSCLYASLTMAVVEVEFKFKLGFVWPRRRRLIKIPKHFYFQKKKKTQQIIT